MEEADFAHLKILKEYNFERYNELFIGHLLLLSGLENVSNHSHKQYEYKTGER